MRNTKQKELILSIINHSKKHPTAFEIYQECQKKITNISLGTVYRNLNILVNEALIKRIKMPNNIDRYDKINNKHIHFICSSCNTVLDLAYIDKEQTIVNDNKVLDYEINYKGICKKCLEKEK